MADKDGLRERAGAAVSARLTLALSWVAWWSLTQDCQWRRVRITVLVKCARRPAVLTGCLTAAHAAVRATAPSWHEPWRQFIDLAAPRCFVPPRPLALCNGPRNGQPAQAPGCWPRRATVNAVTAYLCELMQAAPTPRGDPGHLDLASSPLPTHSTVPHNCSLPAGRRCRCASTPPPSPLQAKSAPSAPIPVSAGLHPDIAWTGGLRCAQGYTDAPVPSPSATPVLCRTFFLTKTRVLSPTAHYKRLFVIQCEHLMAGVVHHMPRSGHRRLQPLSATDVCLHHSNGFAHFSYPSYVPSNSAPAPEPLQRPVFSPPHPSG